MKAKRGFSLMEILLGSVIFATVIVYLAAIWGMHARTIGHARTRMLATFIAQQQIEYCLTLGYSGVDLQASLNWQKQTVTTTIKGVAQSVDYEYKIETQPHTDPLLAGRLKVVKVRVKFAEDSKLGGKSEIVYDTLVSDN